MTTQQNTHEQRGNACHKKRFTEGMLDTDLIVKELDLAPGHVVMDVGCGTGYMSKLFSDEVGRSGTVYAIDVNTSFIESLQAETTGTNITPLVCDISNPTPVKGATVDRIYMSTVLHAQPKNKLGNIIQEFTRLLKPDGILAFVELDKRETPFGPPLKQRYSPEDLKKVLPFEPIRTVPVAEFFYLQLFHA